MPVHTALWKVGDKPEQLSETTLASEQLLENMIIAAPRLLSDEWMLIGRQEDTGMGGRIDLLAIAPDGGLVLIELKRDRTPREVVAQALDYASWVQQLGSDEIAAIYRRFAPGRSLNSDFAARFGQPLDEESINSAHQIIIVAGSLDASTERIVGYLSERDIPVNVLFFQVFVNGTERLISRAWLLDPTKTQVSAAVAPDRAAEPWNGEFYASFGVNEARDWNDAVRYGYISGGGGSWYSRTLQLLSPGDRIWVKVPGRGFVGVGKVTARAESAATFTVETAEGPKPIAEVARGGHIIAKYMNDPEMSEHYVRVQWLQTVPLDKAVQEVGMFGNQNTVCKPSTPKWRSTVDRLKVAFPRFGDSM